MLMANSADQFYRMDEKPELFVKGRQFLDSMNAPVAAAGLELQINNQDETVIKADKKLKKLRDDAIDFEKQKKRLEDKIAENVKDIEKQAGTHETQKWGPRVIDIDILFYGEEIHEHTDLIIPHPYLHERRFTLVPLNQIAPSFIHPLLKKTVNELLNACADQGEVKELLSGK
jgi:hypothetical protein